MVGFGYDTATNTINIKNTWDNGSDTMTWAGSYSGMQHYAVTVLEMDRPPGRAHHRRRHALACR